MSINVNPPPMMKLPSKLQDIETATYFRHLNKMLLQLWKRTGGGSDTIDSTVVQQAININDIATVAAAIDTNTANVATNVTNITTNATNLTTHEALTIAHGSNGDVVGKLDLATESLVGLVKQMDLVSDAVASTVAVASADVAAAGATYDQTYTDTIVTLVNETKADLNTLTTDLNAVITVVNTLLANSKTSDQMNSV